MIRLLWSRVVSFPSRVTEVRSRGASDARSYPESDSFADTVPDAVAQPESLAER